jgi:16S rRNA (cytidine1402-2'-O)-methyltransferase
VADKKASYRRPSPEIIAASGAPAEPSRPAGFRKPADSTPLAPGLYVVATPIGNLGDITLRALDILARAGRIACEDTRITARLLAHYAIRTPMIAYHEHNAARVRPLLIERLKAGESVALVSDAGTPLVSDPGYRLVVACIEAGIAVHPLPGPSSVLAALAAAGLPTDRFLFAGFPPPREAGRRRVFAELAAVPATLVFLESPRRLAESLADMTAVFGDRPAAVARELTKLHEETRRGGLAALAAHYAETGAPKGEVTLVVGPPLAATAIAADDLDERLRAALADMTPSDAVRHVAAETGLRRRDVYARAMALAGRDDDDGGPGP